MNEQMIMERNGAAIYEDRFGRFYFQKEHPESVVILAKDADAFVFIKQFRKPVACEVVQLPGGGIKQDEPVEAAARREFLEETGYECGKLHYLGQMLSASWLSNEITHAFYTDEVLHYKEQRLEQHENIEVVRMNVDQCITELRDNRLQDSELSFVILQAIVKGYLKI